MYALDNDSGVQTMPEVKAKKFNHTEPRWFTEGGNGVAPSYPGADWFNIVQAELLNILIEANITPDKSQLNQITLAIKEVVKISVAESLDGKANKEHNHSYNEIVDFTSGVAAQFFYQKTENFEVFKYPDGSMIQIYKSNPILNHSNTSAGFTFNWAQAFTSIPALTWSVSSDQDAARDCWVTFNKSGTTNTKVKYWIFEGSYNTSNLEVNIIAIGKWK
ncbi:hypothetical protein ACFGYH_02570 [Pasteurella multocida]